MKLVGILTFVLLGLSPVGVVLAADSEPDPGPLVAEGWALVEAGTQAFRDDQMVDAERLLRRGIMKIRNGSNPQNPSLIDPQLLLGVTLQELGRHDDAIDELTRAQHLVHLKGGLLDPQQQEIVYAKLESLEERDEYFIAEQSFHSLVRLNQVNFGETDIRTIEATVGLGEWLTRVGLYRSAISYFRRAAERLEIAAGGQHPGLVAYHIARGRAYLAEGSQRERGLTSIGRAVAIMESISDQFTPDERIGLLISHGEILMRFRREKPAVEQFKTAWRLAQEHSLAPEYARWVEQLGSTRWVSQGMFWPLSANPSGPAILVTFRVNREGRPVNVVVDSPYNKTVESVLKRAFRNTRFQPAIIDGSAVASGQQQEMLITFARPDGSQLTPRFEPIFGIEQLSSGG